MSIQSPFVTVEIIALILCMITIGIAWRYRKKNPIIVPLIALLSMTSVWLFASIGGLSSTDQTINLNWAKVEYIAVVSVPLLLLNFSLHYSLRQRWLTKRRLYFLLIIPVVTLLLAWTNDLHSLIWSQYAVYQESGLTLSEITYGSWFWVYWTYSYVILTIASIIIIRSVIISGRIYRIHGLLIILAIVSPWIGNLIYILNLSPIENLDLTPLAFCLTGLLLAAGMLRWRLFDVVPIARTKVIEEMADAVIILDQLGRIVDANASAEHILGIDIRKACGRQASDILPVKLSLLIQRTNGNKQHFELTLDHKGESRLFEVNQTVFYDRRDMQNGSLLILHDITERNHLMKKLVETEKSLRITEKKRAEEALQSSEEKYRQLFELGSDALLLIDVETCRIIDFNNSAIKTYGYSREEAIQMKTTDFSAEPDETLKAIIESQEHIPVRYHRRKDGSIFPTEITLAYFTRNGKEVCIAAIRDITERKKAEAERQELEKRVQLTDRLASIGEIASGIAHEINNPLTSVVGFSELLLEKDLPEDLREDVKIIHDGSKRVTGIVKRLLTFARQYKPVQSRTDINEIIESTLALRSYALETGNIEVNTSLDAELPWTMADAGQLQQVFMNIIVNAETEMKKAHGKGKLIVKTKQIGNTIRLSFKDDGPGIAKENLGKVFDPFFTTKEVGEGTGLGLSLSHSIITEHKGALYVKSTPGKGATFIIELPIVAEEEEEIEKVEAVEETGKTSGGRILVVDDEPAIPAFLKRVLGGEGYEVTTVSSGEEALDRIESEEYGLILCDIKMPGLSGIEIYEQIEKVASSLQKRVIFITGDVMSADTREFLKRTKVPYVTKPFDIAKLKEEVKRVIAGAGQS